MTEEAAVLMLNAIGVNGDPPAPGASLDAVEVSDLAKPWRTGAIWPMTFKGLVGAMLMELPPESRAAIGSFLVQSAKDESATVP